MKFGWLLVLRFEQQVPRDEERRRQVDRKGAERICFGDAGDSTVVDSRGLSRAGMIVKLSQIGFS